MSIRLPDKLIQMQPYDPTENKYPIKLDANESCFSLPESMRQELARRLVEIEFHRYPDPASRVLMEKAADFFGVQPDNLAAGCGSDELISIITNSFCQKGQRVMNLTPDFSMYRFYADLAELETCQAEKDAEYGITPEQIIAAARQEQPQILIFSNPCNPAGCGLTRGQVQQVVEALPDTLIVLDEAYMDFWDQSLLPQSVQYPNVLVLKTLSKACGMAAIRLGFAIGCAELIEQINKSRSPFNINVLTQTVGAYLLEQKEYLADITRKMIGQKDQLETLLRPLAETYPGLYAVKPSCTNFALLRTGEAEMVYQKLLERGICVRCFDRFGFLRITAGNDQENQACVQALKEIGEEWKCGRQQ